MTANEYGHDFDNPLSQLDALEMAWRAADSNAPGCSHGCSVTYRMLPMTGTAWGLEEFHEDGCPINEDAP
jgi:hypothetical protein